jgi:hypothetical protein
MYGFGRSSNAKLETCHPDLKAVANKVMTWQVYDFTIVWGWRGEKDQNQAFLTNASGKRWPESKHNIIDINGKPQSIALDFAPWVNNGIPWKDEHAFAVLGGMFIAAGAELKLPVRYGGDWDMDGETTDQRLMDWGHVELAT